MAIDGSHPFHGQAAGKGYGVLFTDAHVEEAGGELLVEIHQAGAIGHGRGNGHNLGVLPGQAHQGVAKDLGVTRDLD